ncbi:CpsD/CapB family tyrosine-protein kinase [Paenibacillus lemnae]|uniref:CpsD/CapB family tyrosine-protein kinase n=1 Tax=Paenibacillus lemnae TaxID=1330551 RepID=UPI0031B5C164
MSRTRNEKRHLVTLMNSHSPVSEAYRALRTHIEYSVVDNPAQIIMITSAGREEGKSTVAGNLAVVYAQNERRVLLIDAVLRKPAVHRMFQVSSPAGLSSLLSHQIDLEDAVQETGIPHLYVMTSGPIPPNPAELLGSEKMKELLEQLRTQFDIILIDTPPLLAVTDAQLLASQSDGVLLVMHAGKVRKEIAVKAKENLQRVNARLLGVVLNKVKRKTSEKYYYYYGN